jgi:rhamnulokinase
MSNLYVACELAAEKGRVLLGALQKEGLTISEAGELHEAITDKDGISQWDISRIYNQVVGALRSIAAHDVPVRGLSFHTPAADAVLFAGDGSVITPATRASESAGCVQLNKFMAKVPFETFYSETGTQPHATSTVCQLVAEPSRRLKKASHALSLADGFNYLFSGVPRSDASQATQTQLYNPLTKSWSEPLLQASGLPERIFPQVIPAGTNLGQVRADIAREAGLDEARVITTCSNELAACLSALAIADPEDWAFLWPDQTTLLGTKLDAPFINDASREMKYSNLTAHGVTVGFYKTWVGLRLVEDCRRTWTQQDRALDNEVLMHLATSAPPFEALIDPGDARFLTQIDMPQTIQAFCRETGQEAPRKPGPILRCLYESLALQYRKGLLELEYISGISMRRVYVLGGKSNSLLNHFLANALQIPVVVVPTEIAAAGNVAMQALALGHIPSLELARELVQHSLRFQTINPHATAWTEAYDRFLAVSPS